MDKKEQKNIITEILEGFNSLVIVNLEQNNYAQYFRREDASQSESVERGAYTELLHSLYCGICPLGDESATLEEYLYPACIRRMMTQGNDRLQWEYEDGEKLHKILYVLCIQREDDVPVRLLLVSHNHDGRADTVRILETMQASFGSLAMFASDSGSRVDQECLNQEEYHNRRALLAEDNALSREVTEELLRTIGMEVDTAVNGKEAVSQVAAVPDGYYDIILMDVQMPVMNGCDAARAIRLLDREQAGRIPIVAMTAGGGTEDGALREAGMNDCLTKPVRPRRLMEIFSKALA